MTGAHVRPEVEGLEVMHPRCCITKMEGFPEPFLAGYVRVGETPLQKPYP